LDPTEKAERFFVEKAAGFGIITVKSRIIFVDDTCKSLFGGTALTLNALREGIPEDISFSFLETGELTNEAVSQSRPEDLWIIGNTFNLNQSSVKALNRILMFKKFCKIEFDYGFCNYRCEQGFKHFTGEKEWKPFGAHGSNVLRGIYDLKRKFACKIFYMSLRQMEIHNLQMADMPVLEEKQVVLGSCFCVNDLAKMVAKYPSSHVKTTKTYAIVDGNGGWHSKAKGVKEAIFWARQNNIPFEVIKESNYQNFIERLSRYHGLIFLPQIHDTCPRVTIEAKLMGLNLITNENVQHQTEGWFKLEAEDLANYLLDRPKFFHDSIREFLI